MIVIPINDNGRKGFAVEPETDFEVGFLSDVFIINKERKVIVKSGSSLADLQAIYVFVEVDK